ncbi:PPOX class F420-dependent oxidoreductase [Paractinoplanes atraurantiacus]|uniref:Pyridoxamine 5'-phosphate oxidase family protein n=1 Tax=Paractinoplanes atraurantiacus TaxID=1036182 RepID=A0A285J0L1_9ACTN|nr:PPOX class F420-dependent oxidoreductase [Actinoplanes atraurantiacus]SNY53774.1 pyridoxamine 5'-phosphate oxidase family protein [Actinoplanes atraurantiacus]
MPFTEIELAYLQAQPLGRLATLRPDGTLQNSPVGFRVDAAAGTIDIPGYGMSGSRKYRNVAANGQVAFVVDDVPSVDPWRVRCVEIRGTAEAIGEIIRIHPRRIISFGLDQPDADAHDLVVNSRGA